MINAPAPAKLVDTTLVCDDLKWSRPNQCFIGNTGLVVCRLLSLEYVTIMDILYRYSVTSVKSS